MAQVTRFPESYENRPLREALDALATAPTLAGLQVLLDAATTGGIAVDLTGSPDPSDPRVRTLAATEGGVVLPLFTSLAEVRKAVAQAGGAGTRIQAAILPARQALEIARGDGFVAVQFNPGTHAQVVARKHVEAALDA